jgi:hypothetical protein
VVALSPFPASPVLVSALALIKEKKKDNNNKFDKE